MGKLANRGGKPLSETPLRCPWPIVDARDKEKSSHPLRSSQRPPVC